MLGIDYKDQEGLALFIVIALVMYLGTFGVIVATMIISETNNQTIFVEEHKAFYAAESAVELAISDINNGGDGNLSNITIGDITVTTTNEGDTLVKAVGVSGVTAKVVTQKIQYLALPEAFNYAVSSFNPSHSLKFASNHQAYLEGEVFTYSTNSITLENKLVLNNVTLHVPQGTTVDNKTVYQVTVEEFPAGTTPVDWPVLNTQYYDNYINNAGGYPSYPSNNISTNLDLGSFTDRVLYRSGDLTISGCNITGPGIIVCTNKLTLQSSCIIGPNVVIISGDQLFIKNASQVTGMNSIVYGTTLVDIQDNYTSVSGSILSPTYISFDSNGDPAMRAVITGIVYCPVKVKMRHTILYGSVVTDYLDGDDFHCMYGIWDQSYMPPCPPGFTGSAGSVQLVADSWNILK